MMENKGNPSYFLISVSNRENLELCQRYALAGFTNSGSGVWTFEEVEAGDYISFLYGAKAHNLYQVEEKLAIENAESMPPWKPITFRPSGRTYHFPFRLQLKPVRRFEESLVRSEFAYVAENLLLRGGYRRTHFQADQTTLQNVSQMGSVFEGKVEELETPKYATFTPRFTRNRGDVRNPFVFLFQEFILQAIIRQHLSDYGRLGKLLKAIGVDTLDAKNLEVLGEKALPTGNVDILLKEAVPIGVSRKILVEVKTGSASKGDFQQLNGYVNEIGKECIAGIMIARDFSRKTIEEHGKTLVPIRYSFSDLNLSNVTFEEMKNKFRLNIDKNLDSV